MTWPSIALWLLILACTFQRGPLLVYVFAATGAFGSLQMVPGDMVGGANLLPQSVCAVFLVGKILLSEGQMARALDAALDPAKLGLLFLFLAYGLFTAYAMPRFFAHSVAVIPMSVPVDTPVMLEPSTANITQPAYLALSTGVALAFTLGGRHSHFRRHYLHALLFGGIVLILTGLADLLLASAGRAELLEPFRNASYSLLIDDQAARDKRVVGLTPEASAYGMFCVSAAASLAILRPLFAKLLRDVAVPATVASLVAMALLSTSSTAYVGLGVFGVVYALNWLRRFLAPTSLGFEGLKWEALVAIAALLAFLFMLALAPSLRDPVFGTVNEVVFRKTESESYMERTTWTTVGIDALFATNGFGVGLGSARTSSWYVAILSNTGVIGGALLASFIVRVFLQRGPSEPRAAEFVAALKFSLLPGFAMVGLAGTTPDFGVGMGATFGLITSLASSAKQLRAFRSGAMVPNDSATPKLQGGRQLVGLRRQR